MRPIPQPTPETRHFWDGAAQGKLLLQRCCDAVCAHIYFPPQHFCPKCQGSDIAIIEASGKASLHSYIINERRAAGFEPPFIIAVVKLAEGPCMMANIVECAPLPSALSIDMPLEVCFTNIGSDIVLPVFRPLGDA